MPIAGSRVPFYYGWAILAATAFTEMIALGATSYAAGLFVIPVERELGVARGAANSSIAILFAGGIVMAPVVGRLLDSHPARLVMICGALALAASFAAIAATSSIPLMIVALLLPGAFGFVAIGSLATSTLVSRWFYRRRGLALGIAAVATSGGGIFVVPLLSMAIDAYGWRTALLGEAAFIALAVSAVVLLIIRDSPLDLGSSPHNAENAGRPLADAALRGRIAAASGGVPFPSWRDILASRNFWSIVVVPAFLSAAAQAIVVTLAPYSTGLGFTSARAALLISAFSVAAAITKVAGGILADRLDRRLIMTVAAVSMAASFALLLSSQSYSVLFLSACFAGIALGGVLPASAVLIASCFGAPSFGAVMGWGYALTGVLTIAAVRFIGGMFDRFGNYDVAFAAFAVVSAVVAFSPLLVRDAKAEGGH